MTERTFREPPQNRPASSHGPYPRYEQDEAPPVPALPKDFAQKIAEKSPLRPASVEPTKRISSPPPTSSRGRNVSLDRGPGVLPSALSGLRKKKKADPAAESEDASVRTSVNFSRPMSPQNLPPSSPLPWKRAQSPPINRPFSPNTAPQGEGSNVTKSATEAGDQPVKKKKKKPVSQSPVEGDRISANATNPTTMPTTSELATQSSPLSSTIGPEDSAATKPEVQKKKKKKVVPASASESIASTDASDNESVKSDRNIAGDRSKAFNARASGILTKQPSMVREDREGEEQAEKKQQTGKDDEGRPSVGTSSTATPANTSKVVSKDRVHNRSVSQPTGGKALAGTPNFESSNNERPVSLTPGRAAHFSSQPQHEGLVALKHEPPARSVSPAKSALKSSPSRGHSPAVSRSGLAPSEASDTASQVSDEGSRSASRRRKKNVRVSFDEESVLIGRSAGPSNSAESPVALSPQGRAKPQSWFNLVRDKGREENDSDQDEDSVIKPMPALPSFGSVRDRGQKQMDKSTAPTSDLDGKENDYLRGMSTSTDAAIGNIISGTPVIAKPADKSESNPGLSSEESVPPVQGDTLGSEAHLADRHEPSDGQKDQLASVTNRGEKLAVSKEGLLDPELASGGVSTYNNMVPVIAVEPATPGGDESTNERKSWPGMPGGFPSATETDGSKRTAQNSQMKQTNITNSSPEAAVSGSGTNVVQHETNSPTIIDAEESDESDASSIYSDAAEDQSDYEGDGFGSINAIVESPASRNIAKPASSPPASPSLKTVPNRADRSGATQKKGNENSETGTAEDWDVAQSYWSGLSKARKEQLQHAAMPGAIDEPVLQNKTMRGAGAMSKRKKKTAKNPTPQPEMNKIMPPVASRAPETISATSKVATEIPRKSNLQTTSSATNTKSNPVSREDPKRKSAPAVAAPKSPQKSARLTSPAGAVDYNKAPLGKSPMSVANPPVEKTSLAKTQKQRQSNPPRLQRTGSDSSSSFKRTRARTPEGQQYKMKRSMRGQTNGNQTQSVTTDRTSSLSLRASSPASSVSRRPFSSAGSASMRTSMRDSTDLGKPVRTSLRAPKEASKPSRTKSPSRFGFGKGNKVNSVQAKPASRFASRFGDSSDDEDGLPVPAASRFDASSSDEEPTKLTPVRGIPRRINEGDSTDLEDSSGNEGTANKAHVKTQDTSVEPVSPEGAALAQGSMRTQPGVAPPATKMGTGLEAKKAAEKEKKRRSFFGSLGGKKRDEGPKAYMSGIGNPSQLETFIESKDEEDALRAGTTSTKSTQNNTVVSSGVPSPSTGTSPMPTTPSSTVQNSPKNPKLQRNLLVKRGSSSRDISWPLPQVSAPATPLSETRPRTSDGGTPTSNGGRPSLGLRLDTTRSEADAVPSMNGTPSKKKRFPMLRKAFGLSH